MIVLSVQSYNGVPSANGPSASFDELGGTIGRADHNQLVLPDPERTISRVHARIAFRASGYFIADIGSNPISINGTPVGAGRECPLKPGDRIEIGGYVLAVTEAARAAGDDPFADLFGDAASGLAGPAPLVARPAPAAAAPARPAAAASAGTALWPPPASAPPGRAPGAAAPPAPPAPPAGRRGAAVIPEDWDPFAPDAGPEAPAAASWGAGAAAPSAAPAAPLDLMPAGGESLDDLFGLSSAAAPTDPLGATPAQVLGRPNTAAAADPLWALGQGPAAPAASRPDHLSELNAPMPLAHAAASAPPAAPRPAPKPSGAVFSWDQPSPEGQLVTPPTEGFAAAERAPVEPTAPAPRVARPLAAPAAAVAGTATAAPAPAAAPAGDDALLRAFLEGLASPALRLEALTPDSMRLIGELLREATRGTVELLRARAALKRELRAEMTMIVARENNPLKFSPTADVALQHLLGDRTPGFMAPGPALRDAYDDLRAHQLGVMAGMRAALEGVLARFDPAQLEAKLSGRSPLTHLIPAARKARLWELFQELFAQLQREAQDDFDELFGRAFLRAYEEQLARLADEPR